MVMDDVNAEYGRDWTKILQLEVCSQLLLDGIDIIQVSDNYQVIDIDR